MRLFSALKRVAVVAMGMATLGANANSVSLDQFAYTPNAYNQIVVTVTYDFTDFSMFGGGLDLYYNSDALRFESYTQASLDGTDAQSVASPVGEHVPSENIYSGFGIGTFSFQYGMNSQGIIGVFVFTAIGYDSGNSPCGWMMCLSVNGINPFISLVGENVSDELIGNGISTGTIALPVPLPAAVWLMLGGLGMLAGLRRTR